MANPIRKLVQLVLDKRAADKMEKDTKKSLNVVDKGFAKLRAAALRLGATIAVAMGVRAIIRFGKESVRVAAEAEAIWNRLGQAVENVGVSFADARPEVDAFARAMQDVTVVGDEDFAAVLTELITISGDYARSLNNVGVVADLAAAKQIDLRTAAQLVGRVMLGETSMLKRYGVVVAEGADGMQVLRDQFRGFAENEAKSLQGRLAQLNNEWGDFKQAVGDAMIAAGGGTSVIETLTATVRTMTEWVNANQITWQRWGENILALLERIGGSVQRVMDQMDPLGKRERDHMTEILQMSEDQLALTEKRFRLGQQILELEEKRKAEVAETVRLEALAAAIRTSPLAVRQSRFRAAALEDEIRSLQALINKIDELSAPDAAPGAGVATPSAATPDAGGGDKLTKAQELMKLWEDFPAVMANFDAAGTPAEQMTDRLASGWERLNSEMEVSAETAAKLAGAFDGVEEAARTGLVEIMALNAAADLGGSLIAALFGSDIGKLAAQKAEQNAIMAAEQLAMAAAVAFIPGFQGEAAGHVQAAGMFAGVAAAWGALAGATGGFSGGGGGGAGARGGPSQEFLAKEAGLANGVKAASIAVMEINKGAQEKFNEVVELIKGLKA